VLGCRPVLTSDVPAVPPIFVNGPDADVELNTWYHVAPADAVQDMVIELDDFTVAVTPVGAAGGRGFVVSDAGGLDSGDVPPVFDARTT
jgi:hypothetical protein